MTEPPAKVSKMASALDQLKNLTTVVADTGDFEGKRISPEHYPTHLLNRFNRLYSAGDSLYLDTPRNMYIALFRKYKCFMNAVLPLN